jgi:hypothetical protein
MDPWCGVLAYGVKNPGTFFAGGIHEETPGIFRFSMETALGKRVMQ